jgi:hypothetical protein
MGQKWNEDKNFERGGYRPLNEGYSPGGEKGYKPVAQRAERVSGQRFGRRPDRCWRWIIHVDRSAAA